MKKFTVILGGLILLPSTPYQIRCFPSSFIRKNTNTSISRKKVRPFRDVNLNELRRRQKRRCIKNISLNKVLPTQKVTKQTNSRIHSFCAK